MRLHRDGATKRPERRITTNSQSEIRGLVRGLTSFQSSREHAKYLKDW